MTCPYCKREADVRVTRYRTASQQHVDMECHCLSCDQTWQAAELPDSEFKTTMAVFCDTEADAAHIALLGGIGPGETVRNHQTYDGKIILDFNASGQLIGIELLDLDILHPDLVKGAIQMRPIREGDL